MTHRLSVLSTIISLLFLMTLTVSAASAQRVTVQNETADPVDVVTVDASLMPDLQATSRAAVAALLSGSDIPVVRLPPRGSTHVDIALDEQALLAVRRPVGQIDFPVHRLDSSPDRLFQWIDAENAMRSADTEVVTIRNWEAPTDRAPLRIDNRYTDWLSIPDLAEFPPEFRPETFALILDHEREEVDIEDSLLWQYGGSQLERLKALRFEDSVFVMSASFSPISSEFSLLLRVFFGDQSDDEQNRFTVEIPADDVSGPVLLWEEGISRPRVIGEYARSRFLLEARVSLAAFPGAGEGTRIPPETSVDIVSTVGDAGMVEEFFHMNSLLEDIPRIHGR